jgi:hypothetical protein
MIVETVLIYWTHLQEFDINREINLYMPPREHGEGGGGVTEET